ncbi:MlaD family protein [Patulibacter sp. SYSU D01012]|uniref:MlaD family protein n=1 Tax=Patulibacter sp. SYSU D01012 TaxID=2817381 RepID=UPI001B314133
MRRSAPLVLLAALVVVLGIVLLGGSSGHEYRLVFANSSQIVKGGVVRIGGTPVGTVKSLELTKDDLAEVRVSVDDEFAPLREGSTAVIRVQGQASVASRYVDISPAPTGAPLKDDAIIPIDKTTSQVELDQVFSAFDKGTRTGLQKTIKGFSQWYAGREREGATSARELPQAVAALRGFAEEVNAQSADFERLVSTSGQAMSRLATEREALTGLVSGAGRTVQALGADTQALTTALTDLPPALRQGTTALANLRPALGDLRDLVDAADEPSRELTPFLQELTPVVDRAVPVFKQLRQIVDRSGEGNDVLDALRDLPALEKSTSTAFPNGTKALKESTPMLSFIRPYTADLMAWFRSFGSAAATYDGAGHYLSTMPVFDAFKIGDDGQGGKYVDKPPAERGKGTGLSTGNLRRCPGAATAAPADGSAPFVDAGELANADCDPSQRPGGR